jgi:hypothetical protein
MPFVFHDESAAADQQIVRGQARNYEDEQNPEADVAAAMVRNSGVCGASWE